MNNDKTKVEVEGIDPTNSVESKTTLQDKPSSSLSLGKRLRSILVPVESPNLLPERDLGKIPVLQAEHLGIDFGGLTAVDNFNIAIGKTEIAGLIGPNGAGKTTIFNLLTNVYKPTRGTVLVDGYDTAGKTITQVNKMGVARTFQNIRLFNQMSVLDNILVGFNSSMSTGLVSDVFRLPKHWRQEREFKDKAYELLGCLLYTSPSPRD